MKGLIYKDLMTIVHELHRVALFMLIAVFGAPVLLAVTSGEIEMLYTMPLTMCPVVGMVMINNTFGYDEKSGWMQYALTNPVSRMQYYHSKFLTHAVNTICGSLLGFAISAVLAAVSGQMTFSLLGQLLAQAAATAAVMCLIGTWIIPMFLKYGVQKGTLMVMMVFISIAVVCTGLVALGYELVMDPFSTELPILVPVLIVGVVLGSFVALYLLGRKWVLKKEF